MINIESENELYIEFNLLYFLHKPRRGILPSRFLNPYGITTENTFKIIKDILLSNDILNLIYLTDSTIKGKKENIINAFTFFNTDEYIGFKKLEDLGFELIDNKNKLIIKNKYNEFLKKVSDFYLDDNYIFERKIIYNKLKLLYDLNGEKFNINSGNFSNTKIHFLHFIYSYLHLGYIKLDGLHCRAYYKDNYLYMITVTKKGLNEINKSTNFIEVITNNLNINTNISNNNMTFRNINDLKIIGNIDINQSNFGKMLEYCFINNIKGPIDLRELYKKIGYRKSKEDSNESFKNGKSLFINKYNEIKKEDIDYLINKEKRGSSDIVLNFKRTK